VSDRLADDLRRVLAEHPYGLPCAELARRVHRRRSDVLATLRTGPFEHRGRTCGSRWRVAAGSRRRGSRARTGSNVLPWDELDRSGVPAIGRRTLSA
jgi:hypothetical protein